MKIQLAKPEYTDIEVGENQLFKVTSSVYNEETHKLRITYRDKAGNTHSEFFQLESKESENADYTPDAKGLKMFAILYRGVTGERNADEADPDDLVGRYFTADVKQGKQKDDGTYWLNVWSKRPSDLTFEDVPDTPKKETSDDADEW